MNKYKNNNNFSRSPSGDSAIRFNKRPRYGTNSNIGGSGNSRFNQQNPSTYQYSQNRNNSTAGDPHQSNKYEKGSRHFYGISPKRLNHNHNLQQNKQSSPYLRKSMAPSSCLSPSSSSSTSFNVATQNVLNLPPIQPETTQQTVAATMSAQNNQQQQLTSSMMDSTNFYGFGYNNSFYANNYNPDLIPTAPTSTFGVGDGMSPYMWQTIKSTPPPKLPHQQQLLPPPPLPQQQPPPQILPPLPTDDAMPPQLPPPPSIPTSIATSTNTSSSSKKTDDKTNKTNDQESTSKTVIKMKAKRKAMSMRYKLCKSWSEEDALLALKAEEANVRRLQKDIILIVRFPDPEISREIVKCYSPDIESVHFQLNFAPRYCLVHLKPGTDVEKTIEDLSKIPFGTGYLSVEIKQIPFKTHSTKLNEIDPYTLYVGNLPTTIACKTLKEHFPGAARIDIGFAQRMKYTRYAFIRYQTVQQAIEAYKRMLDAEIGGRNLTIRFRRVTPASDGNKDGGGGDNDVDNVDDMHDDLLSQTTVTSEDSSAKLSQTLGECKQPDESLEEKDQADHVGEDSNNMLIETEKNDNDFDRSNAQKCSSTEDNSNETNNCTPPMSATQPATTIQDTSNTPLLNIKPDPDIDPDDIVIRDNAITSRFEVTNDTIKQEDEEAMYMEFFAPPKNQTESTTQNTGEQSTNNDSVSLPLSSADETDTISNLSVNSLGEFLQNCQRSQIQDNSNRDSETPPTKRTKVADDTVNETIKKEPLENVRITVFERDHVTATTVKEERVEENETSNNTRNKNTSNTNNLVVNRTVPTKSSKEQNSTSNNSGNTLNTLSNTVNNDEDLVPSTALFFRNSSQNTLSKSNNICDYDEFYETRINTSSQISTSAANIKREPLDTSLNRRESSVNSKDINETLSSKLLQRTITMSNAIDDDDLVPAQNLLGSYRPLENDIKREMEHDDLFTMPFNKTNDNDMNNLWNKNGSGTNSTTQLHKSGTNSRNKEPLKDSDDDVIIISDNISRQPNQIPSNTLVLGNLFFRKQPDLVTFKPKPIAATFSKRETSKLILHHDNLDKLYEQLDADSDSDL